MDEKFFDQSFEFESRIEFLAHCLFCESCTMLITWTGGPELFLQTLRPSTECVRYGRPLRKLSHRGEGPYGGLLAAGGMPLLPIWAQELLVTRLYRTTLLVTFFPCALPRRRNGGCRNQSKGRAGMGRCCSYAGRRRWRFLD